MDYHYFATTVSDWVVGHTIAECMAKLPNLFEKGRYGKLTPVNAYGLVKVPLPITAQYEIDHYMPQVDGCEIIESFSTVNDGYGAAREQAA